MITDTEGIVLRQVKAMGGRRMISLFSQKYGKISVGTSINEGGRNKTALSVKAFSYGKYELFKSRDNYNLNNGQVLKSYYGLGEDLDKYIDGITAKDLMKRPEVHYDDIVKMCKLEKPLVYPNNEQIDIEVKYQGYIDKAYKEAKRVLKLETVLIPSDICYDEIPNLASEAREKLNQVRPLTIGQANRISGVNPADISILLVYLESRRK